MATAAELAGVQPPAGLDSISFAPTLRGDTSVQATHEYLYWEFHEGGFKQAALWQGRWKGLRSGSAPAELVLYDLESDPGERTDVAAQQAEIAQRLSAYLDSARSDNPDWVPVRR